jgi:hypothetical protein
MPASALTSDNSAIVMIDHAAGFGNVFRSHDISPRRPPETRPAHSAGAPPAPPYRIPGEPALTAKELPCPIMVTNPPSVLASLRRTSGQQKWSRWRN